MLKFVVSAAVLLTSSAIASACSVEGRIDDAVNCEKIADGPKIQLANQGGASTARYNRQFMATHPGPAQVTPKQRAPRRPR
jgi:hypothetical protein